MNVDLFPGIFLSMNVGHLPSCPPNSGCYNKMVFYQQNCWHVPNSILYKGFYSCNKTTSFVCTIENYFLSTAVATFKLRPP